LKTKRVLIIGVGSFGSALCDELWTTGADILVVDQDPAAVDRVKGKAAAAFIADGTDPKVLESVGAGDVDVAVVCAGEDFEATVLAVSQLAQMKVRVIIARAASERQAHVLRAVGATRAVLVENEMGRRLAVEVLNPVAAPLMDFATHFRVVPWVAVAPYVGKKLSQADLRRYEINVLGYFRPDPRNPSAPPRLRWPTPDYEIGEGDTLLIVSLEDNIERFLAVVAP
jgi:trk system potassium uptake protein TrkA